MPNGFSRAQRSYDAQEPPDSTDDWEAYEQRHDTPANKSALITTLLTALTDNLSTRECEMHTETLRTIVHTGVYKLPSDGRDKLYQLYDIAPSFEAFDEQSREDDGPDPDIDRDD